MQKIFYPFGVNTAARFARRLIRPARQAVRALVAGVRLKQMRAEYGARKSQVALLVLAAICAAGAVVLAVL